MRKADLILTGGQVETFVSPRLQSSAVAVADGRIAAVGDDASIRALAGPRTRRIDLAGRCVVPGFNDAHVHVWKMGQLLTGMLDLRGVTSIAALTAAVRARAAGLPQGAWLTGRGYNEARIAERRGPSRQDLDAAAPGRPVYLTRTCGHMAVANSRALAIAGVGRDTAAPAGGAIVRDESGEPTGLLQETAMDLVLRHVPEPTPREYEAMILAGARHQLDLGITSATEAGVPPVILDVYRTLDKSGALPYRVNVMALRRSVSGTRTFPLPGRYVSGMLRVDSVKLIADGGLSGATAALSVPYRHQPHRGLLRLEPGEILELAREAHDAGLRVGTHAIGDAAIEATLEAYEALGRPARGPGHRIEHLGLPDRRHLERIARLGVIAVPQPVFIHSLGENFRRYLPDALAARAYPIRTMLDAGITVAFSSDAPVVEDDDPLLGMRAAVTREDRAGATVCPDEGIAPWQALEAYTLGGARASGDARNRGALQRGHWADLAVLSGNPFIDGGDPLDCVRVEMTILGGRIVFER